MATYTQDGRPLAVLTPLGKDALIITEFHGTDAISQPFRYTIEAKSVRDRTVPFESLLGKGVAVRMEMSGKQIRYFHGIVVQLVQGESDPDFTEYQFDIVPQFWLLSKKTQSRIFQHLTVPEILKKVLQGLDVEYQLNGKYDPRDYCVQYRESDMNFASRLMEEEGIYFFFSHAETKHTMVVADTPQSHKPLPGNPSLLYKMVNQESAAEEDHISELAKVQQQASGKFLLWDHTFELPHQHLESEKPLTSSVQVGKVTHKLDAGQASKLEVYDFPGEYAQRFDGIDPSGSPRGGEMGKVPQDGKRTVELRMQQEAAQAVGIRGTGSVRAMHSGSKFSIRTLPSDLATTPIKCEGEYILTSVTHSTRLPATYRSGDGSGDEGFRYVNTFQAMPSALPFRPARSTAKPVVPGMQTAQVVGPKGEEIFTDKYGRIKVQFHWDRDGQRDANSSCWIRVAQFSAGRGWGMFSLPRIGQEVIVDFLEGDPDQPIVVGSVYNPDQMPKYELPKHKTRTYFRSNSSPGGVGYNAIRVEDKAGEEQIYTHAQKDYDLRVRNDYKERIGNDRHSRTGFYLANDHKGDTSGETKKGSSYEEIAVDEHRKVHRHFEEHIGGDYKLLVGGIDGEGNVDIHIKKTKSELIDDTSDLVVKKAVQETFEETYDQTIGQAVVQTFGGTWDHRVGQSVTQTYGGTLDLTVGAQKVETIGAGYDLSVGADFSQQVGGSYSLNLGTNLDLQTGANAAIKAGANVTVQGGGNVVIEATNITLKGAGGFITISPTGVAIQGTVVMINSGGAAIPGMAANTKTPQSAKKAKDAKKAKKAKDAKPTKSKDSDGSSTGVKSN
jgi:type VI secretion system secreted protein VgrG